MTAQPLFLVVGLQSVFSRIVDLYKFFNDVVEILSMFHSYRTCPLCLHSHQEWPALKQLSSARLKRTTWRVLLLGPLSPRNNLQNLQMHLNQTLDRVNDRNRSRQLRSLPPLATCRIPQGLSLHYQKMMAMIRARGRIITLSMSPSPHVHSTLCATDPETVSHVRSGLLARIEWMTG